MIPYKDGDEDADRWKRLISAEAERWTHLLGNHPRAGVAPRILRLVAFGGVMERIVSKLRDRTPNVTSEHLALHGII